MTTKMINENEQLYEALSSCATVIGCPRGEFYPDKNFGSQIKQYADGITQRQALSYAWQAVRDFDGVLVKAVEPREDRMIFTIMINDEEGQVSVKL